MTETHHTFCRICESLCGLEVTVDDGARHPDPPRRRPRGHRRVRLHQGHQAAPVLRLARPAPLPRAPRRATGGSGSPGARPRARSAPRSGASSADHGPDSRRHVRGHRGRLQRAAPRVRPGVHGRPRVHVHVRLGHPGLRQQVRRGPRDLRLPVHPAVPRRRPHRVPDHRGRQPGGVQVELPAGGRPHQAAPGDRGARRAGVVVDPRRTETARAATDHVFIRPDTDVFFYLAFLHELIATGRCRPRAGRARTPPASTEVERPGRALDARARRRGHPASRPPTLRELVAAYRAADGAALYCSTGVNMGTNGVLAFWLQEVINAVSGNLDRRGRHAGRRGRHGLRPVRRAHRHAHDRRPLPHRRVPQGERRLPGRRAGRRDPHPGTPAGAGPVRHRRQPAHHHGRRRPAARGVRGTSSCWSPWTSTATRPAPSPTTRCPPPTRSSGPTCRSSSR